MPAKFSAIRFLKLIFAGWIILLLGACSSDKTDNQLIGFTMGTTYSVQFGKHDAPLELEAIQQKIEKRLEYINQLMSTYIPNSQLSVFNQSSEINWHTVDTEVIRVIQLAQEISEKSEGGFDVTVGPLVNLWGFGPHEAEFSVPSEAEIHVSQQIVGYENLDYQISPAALKKNISQLYVDLSAIAKGYAVDEIAEILDAENIKNYMAEIGGEIKSKGVAAHGDIWRVGIETPQNQRGDIEAIVSLPNVGVATSGDYRNYFVKEGNHYSHTIDPRTGYPVNHNLASVTVIADSVAVADAWATAFMVLGPAKALEISEQEKLAIMLITREENKFKMTANQKMQQYLAN